MAQYENPVFYAVDESLEYISSENRNYERAKREVFALRDLKRAMLELELYEDLAIFRRLEIKHKVDINV
jgi:hypothetical protein